MYVRAVPAERSRWAGFVAEIIPGTQHEAFGSGQTGYLQENVARIKKTGQTNCLTCRKIWWALRDSNPEPRDYESPALTVAPRALVISGCKGNGGLPCRETLHHDVKYYHARGTRSTHDLVDQEDHGAAFDLVAYMKKGPNLRWSLIQCSGGDEGDRTPDLLTASQALSQLSYAPVRRSTIRELPRRCKDIFGKTFWGARGHASGDRDAPAPPEPARWRRHGRRQLIRGPSWPSPPVPWAARRETAPSTTSGRPPPRRPATKPAHLLPLGGTARPHRRWQNENRR